MGHTFLSSPSTILVTGGCGYLGSQLIHDLAGAFPGSTIRILDNLQSNNHHVLTGLPDTADYQFLEGDLLDPAVLRLALEGIDTVIHLAAVVRTPMSFQHPTWVHQVNHWGTSRLVERCLQLGVRRFVFTSSSAVYGPGGPFRETDSCRPIGPYATSKYQAEREVLTAVKRGLEVTILRLGMLFGRASSMRFDGVVNRFAYLAGTGRPLTIHGSGEQRRPVLHVRDAGKALLTVLQQSPAHLHNVIYNVLADNPRILDIASAFQAIRSSIRTRFTEQDVLSHLTFELDGSNFAATGWRPTVSLSDGLLEMLADFRNLRSPPPIGDGDSEPP